MHYGSREYEEIEKKEGLELEMKKRREDMEVTWVWGFKNRRL